MLKDGSGFKRIILRVGYTDLRLGIDSLCAFIKLHYGLEPLEKGTLFLFCGRKADRIKGICFEGNGITLYYKRLASGNRFQWPRDTNEARTLTEEQ